MQTFLLFLGVTVLCAMAAQRMASARGRDARYWMMAATLLGPLPLMPLALIRKR